jgi:hypothetical protein
VTRRIRLTSRRSRSSLNWKTCPNRIVFQGKKAGTESKVSPEPGGLLLKDHFDAVAFRATSFEGAMRQQKDRTRRPDPYSSR